MIERRQQLGFALESREPIGVAGEGLRQYFDRDLALQPRIARAIDFAHAARADERDDFVSAETTARRKTHRL
jgi:hypothetical protein